MGSLDAIDKIEVIDSLGVIEVIVLIDAIGLCRWYGNSRRRLIEPPSWPNLMIVRIGGV